MPVETLQRPVGVIRKRSVARKRRPLWPALLVIVLAVGGTVVFLGTAAGLIAIGCCGIAAAAFYAQSVSLSARRALPARGGLLFLIWLIAIICLSLSFIASGAALVALGDAGAQQASEELARTGLAALVLTVWWLGVRSARQEDAPFVLFFTLAAVEVSRLLLFSLDPGVLSYVIWAATIVSAVKSKVWASFSA